MRREASSFVGAAVALWLVFFVQALWSPILLDDWFQLRYWRDHEIGVSALWMYGHHNYFHYNPRIGEVFLAIVDGSQAIHLIVTPLVQLSLIPIVFAIAFGRWPRTTLRDLQLLLFVQVMIWLVIPIPGILYFYRPFTTNYLWGFTLTLALFVPYRLALAAGGPRRLWLAPIMVVLGWVVGMCNEHTGPTAMVAMAAVIVVAYRRQRLRIWMVAGMAGLYIGYPMLFFAPGQSVRYAGLATRATPTQLLAERGIIGCFEILQDFVSESWLGIVLFLAALAAYLIKHRTRPVLSRPALIAGAALLAAALAIVATLFASPTTTDRVFFASGVLLVAAFAIVSERIFEDRDVRRFVVGACIALALYHCVRFTDTAFHLHAETEQRVALMAATPPGGVAVVPSYAHPKRSRWYLGDDFIQHPWLADYVGGELFDLAGVELDRPRPGRSYVRHVATPPIAVPVPTYRQWLTDPRKRTFAATVTVTGLPFEDRKRRPVVAYEGAAFVDGRPYDDLRGHFIRVVKATLPAGIESMSMLGCGLTRPIHALDDGDHTLFWVDERLCRGPFTALVCQPTRCWVAGWY